jgi:hypothetical protein
MFWYTIINDLGESNAAWTEKYFFIKDRVSATERRPIAAKNSEET